MAKRTRTALREEARRKGARLDERRSVCSHKGGRRPGLVKKLRRKRVRFVEESEGSPRRPRQRAQSRCSTGMKLPIERRKTMNLLMSGQQAEGETNATALVQPDNCCATNLASGHPQVKRSRTIRTEGLPAVVPVCREGDFVGPGVVGARRNARVSSERLTFLREAGSTHLSQKFGYAIRPQQFLNFFPLPQGHGSLRPTFGTSRWMGSVSGGWSPSGSAVAVERPAL
jgi:hypothetical protein